MNKTFQYKNGSLLAYAEYGDKNGYPILTQHGMIASIKDYHLFDSLIGSGVRVICIARPGYSESSPYLMTDMAEWGEIVALLVDELEIPHFDVLGMSSGAPYSYSIGYKMPDKVGNIFIFSGTPALYDARVLALWPYPVKQDASIAELEQLVRDLFFSNLQAEDLTRNDIRDSTRNNCFGIAQDLKLRCVTWGFSLSEVRTSVYMQHGQCDEQVPFSTAEITSRLLPNCVLEAREQGGHFSNEILDAFTRTTVLKHYGNFRRRSEPV